MYRSSALGAGAPRESFVMDQININRAPVLTLWAAVVAERLGFAHDEALTLGKAVAGLNAYSKGKALGLFKPSPAEVRAKRAEVAKKAGVFQVELLHRAVPVVKTSEGLRAVVKEKPVEPASVQKYLTSKFKDALGPVSEAMVALADSKEPDELMAQAYALYEQFRPEIPAGEAGWGAAGILSLKKIRAMARSAAG
jgi:hypothetical protein